MSKRSMWLLWASGFLLSLVLFTVGIARPWLAQRRYAREPVSIRLDPGKDTEVQEALLRLKRETHINYWVGAAMPGLILAGVLFAIQRSPGPRDRS